MTVWDLSLTIREFVFDFTVVGTLLVIGTIARARLPWFQRFLIPSNLIAGFVGLILGPELLNLIDFSPERMGVYVYHLLALTFVGVGLRHTGGRSAGAIHIGFIRVLTYILQALIGIAVALLFLWLTSPELVPAVGMLLPLGFGMGPGIAYSIVDLLVTSAIMAISLSITWRYIGPIAVMSALGAVATYYTIRWGMNRGFARYRFERTVGLYAEQTGTISSGLALIRVTDPEFATPIAQDQVLGSGAALAIGFPLLLVINIPLAWYGGHIEGYVVVAALLGAYLLITFGLWSLFQRKVSVLSANADPE